jgi:cysteine dioxygenase
VLRATKFDLTLVSDCRLVQLPLVSCRCRAQVCAVSRMTLDALVAQLRSRLPPSQPLAPTANGADAGLDEALAGVRVEMETLAPYCLFRRGRYTRNLVHREPSFELVLNCWDAGAVSPVHGHDGQECWFSIQAGTFLLENFPLLAGGQVPGLALLGAPERLGPVGAGHVDHRSPQAPVHRVSAVQGPGLSLHVYARPIDSCLVYDVARGRCHVRVLRYDTVFGRAVDPVADRSQADGAPL